MRELRQLGDRRALIAHPLEMEIRVEDREHEPKIACNGGLSRQQQLDLVLDVEAAPVDVVVERDHLAGQLDVLRDDSLGRTPDRALHELRLDLERLLEMGELVVEGGARSAHSAIPTRVPGSPDGSHPVRGRLIRSVL